MRIVKEAHTYPKGHVLIVEFVTPRTCYRENERSHRNRNDLWRIKTIGVVVTV